MYPLLALIIVRVFFVAFRSGFLGLGKEAHGCRRGAGFEDRGRELGDMGVGEVVEDGAVVGKKVYILCRYERKNTLEQGNNEKLFVLDLWDWIISSWAQL